MKKLLLLVFLVCPIVSHATTVERLTLDDLVKKAGKIVVGRVNGSRTYWSGQVILTSYTIDVQEIVKGPASRTIEVTTIGGTIGDITLHVAGMPSFRRGEDAVVFVENTGAFSTVVGLSQGKFGLRNGEVTNTIGGLEFPDGRTGKPLNMSLESFKNQIRRRLTQ